MAKNAKKAGDNVEPLIAAASAAAARAHCPYSRFRVGAAILDDAGKVHVGCNVENVSYGLTICAERSAIFRMIADGGRKARVVAIYTPTPTPTPPCGACRQVLAEFADQDLRVISTCTGKGRLDLPLTELLPHSFANATPGKKTTTTDRRPR